MKLIFGSTAIKFWFKDYSKKPKDLDYISNENNKSTKEIEYFWTSAFDYLLKNNKNEKYVDPNLLYTIKLSHLSWDINWDKHMKDTVFLKNKGCVVDYIFYDLLYKDWLLLHGKKNVKMNVSNDSFFKENIYRKYNHEWLHEQFAFNERPLNELIRKDINSPLCSKELWDCLSHENKINCATEELFVLTSERYIFVEKSLPLKLAKVKMLKNMITSTTSGWFNLFLKENFLELKDNNPEFIIERIKKLNIKES